MAACIGAIVLVAGFRPASLFAQQTVGYVLEIHGTWTIEGAAVKKGWGLPAGSTLSNSRPSDGDRIVVTNTNGGLLFLAECRKNQCSPCRKAGDCTGRIGPLPGIPTVTPEAETATQMIVRVISDMFKSKPEKYVFTRVRGDSLTDSVLRLTANGCDLAPALSDIERGTYGIRFASIPIEGRPGPAFSSETLALNWDPAKSGPLSVPGLHPGLYEILLTPRESPAPASAVLNAWVLVADADFEKIARDFKSAESMTSSWEESVSPETTQGYLRAHLEYLAGQLQPGR